MATAEQNTLLMNQLFRQPVEDYVDRSNQKLKILLAIAQGNQDAQLRRELAAQQAAREQAHWDATVKLEDARIKGAEARQTATITAAEARQKKALEERDALELQKAFQQLYPQYTRAAAEAGQDIKPITDYEKTPEGLGQLTADLGTVKVGYQQKLMMNAAEASVAEHQDLTKTALESKKRLADLSKPSPQDEKMARSAAVTAVKTAIETDPAQFGKPSKEAITKGIDALAKGNTPIVQKLLGEQALRSFEDAYDKALFSIPNVKSQMQARDQAQKQFLQDQQNLFRVDAELRKMGGTNPYIPEKMQASRATMRDLMTTPEAPRRRTIDEIMGQPPASGGTTGAKTETGTTTGTTTTDLTPPYSNPAFSLLGAGERAGGYVGLHRLMSAPPIAGAMLPLQAIDMLPRAAVALKSGLLSGNYALPPKGPLESTIGLGIRQFLSPSTFTADQAPQAPPETFAQPQIINPFPVNADAILAERPQGPWSPAEMKAIRDKLSSQGNINDPNLLQNLFPAGAR